MECCQCEGIELKFDREYAQKKLKKYRKVGPKKTTRLLTDVLKGAMDEGMTLLDIGGGLGDIQHELLPAGVSESFNCEASTGYIEACKEEAEKLGHAKQITHIQGNFTDEAERTPTADIVTLDRVICCYHDMPELVGKSLAKSRKLYGIVIPIDRWWLKAVIGVYYNLRFQLQNNPFRIYVHPTEAIEKLIADQGFRKLADQVKGTWQVLVYEKV